MRSALKRPSWLKRLAKLVVPRALRPSQFLGFQIQARANQQIQSGPFQGMQYLEHSYWNLYYPKLLGTYEQELSAHIEQMILQEPPLIINVGAGEGYFAVGIARRLPNSQVVAFEATASERDRLARMCALNGVEGQVCIRATCEPQLLGQAMSQSLSPYVICDVEGYEDQLLRPEQLTNVEGATFLVEVHEFTKPSLRQELLARFQKTHLCELVWPQPRTTQQYPFQNGFTRLLPQVYVTGPMNEFRPKEMCWMIIKPRKGNE
jgi:hypothetical protein